MASRLLAGNGTLYRENRINDPNIFRGCLADVCCSFIGSDSGTASKKIEEKTNIRIEANVGKS